MPSRILKENICTSETIDKLSAEEERFFYRLIVQCDDFGRLDARPQILRAKCFPLKTDSLTNEDIMRWLKALVNVGLIELYEVDGRPYLQIVTWAKHQRMRAKESKYPDPSKGKIINLSSDDTCCQMTADDRNCQQMRPYTESYSDTKSNIGISYSDSDTDTKSKSNLEVCTNVQTSPQSGQGEERINNSALIAELTKAYRETIPPEKYQKGDYAFVGRLYNQYGYDTVLMAINELGYTVEGGFVPEKPLVYLHSLVKKVLSYDTRAAPKQTTVSQPTTEKRKRKEVDLYEEYMRYVQSIENASKH